MKTNTGIALRTALAPMSWGTTYVTVTSLLPAGRPLLVAALRMLPAAGILIVLAGASTRRWVPPRHEWRHLGVLALANFGAFFPLLTVAVYRLPGGVAAAFGGTQPLLVAAASWVLVRRRPTARDVGIGAAAMVGVAMVAIRPGADLDAVGLLAALAANVSFAVGVALTGSLARPANRLLSTGWQLLIGGAITLPLTLLIEGAPPAMTIEHLAGFAYLSGVATALAFVLWFDGIRRLPSTTPPLLGLAAPFTGALLGWLLLSQSLSPVQLAGFAVTSAAVWSGVARAPSPPVAARTVGDQCPYPPVRAGALVEV